MVENDFQFISTKLFIPSLRQSLVTRRQLLAQLDDSLNHSITLVCAPAGYGKTTLLAAWIQNFRTKVLGAQGSPTPEVFFSWVSLDQEDNDPLRLIRYIAASLEGVQPGINSDVQQLLNSFPPPSLPVVLTYLINRLSQLSSPIVLIFDDYQFISNTVIHEGIAFFLDHAPPNLHLVIATRSDPPIPTARLRARGQLLEIRADDLRFSPDETEQFLGQVMGVSLSPENIIVLDQRTEGWIAGLQMAALSMHGRSNVSEFIEAFSGSHRYVLDYLAEEVLNRQPENVVEFLIKTSILDRLSAPLCEAVIGIDAAEARGILEYLDHANLFLVRLDDDRRWFRYHHLFADLLRARLLESTPNLVSDLHLRASGWYERNGLLNEAVQHAFSANDNERAVEIIDRYATIHWSHGDPSLIRMAGRLPDEVLQSHLKTCVCWVWIQIARGEAAAAYRLLDGLKSRLPENLSTESGWVPAFVDLLIGYGSQSTGARTHPKLPDYQLLGQIPGEETGLREAADFMYVILLNRQGDFDQSAKILERYTNLDVDSIGPIAKFWLIAVLARIWAMQGRLADSAALCRNYLRPGAGKQKGPFSSAGILNIFLGEVLCEWNQLDEAEEQTRIGISKNEPWHNISFEMFGYANLAGVQMARGDVTEASNTLKKLDELLEGRTLPPDQAEELMTIKVRLCLFSGDLASADEFVKKFSTAQPQDYMQEWGWISLARVRIHQGRYREAQEVLERLIRMPGTGQRLLRQIKTEALLSVALFLQNKVDSALGALERCLGLAEPGGFIRVFLDSGEPAQKLLLRYLQSPSTAHKAYVQKILAEFAKASESAADKTPTGMIEELTPRELEVLGLMAAGLSNRQIAEMLVVAEGTVKFYVHAVLEKLEVHSRTQAIAAARERKLIQD